MYKDFTLILLSQHYPISQQFQLFSFKDVFADSDVADFLQTAELQINSCVLDSVYAYASEAVQ